MKKFMIGLAALIVVAILGFVGYTWLALHWSYSEGERAGYLQKFSKKGWVCKTYEGEIAMTTMPGVAPVIWSFTVKDEQVAKQLESQIGKMVDLHYEQHMGLPSSCLGESQYFVTKATPTNK